jgi:hypothetical protein
VVLPRSVSFPEPADACVTVMAADAISLVTHPADRVVVATSIDRTANPPQIRINHLQKT